MDLFRKLKIDVAIEKHINFFAQFSRANILVAKINVRDLPLIQRITHPTDGIGVRPGNPNAKARYFGRVLRNIGHNVGGDEREIQLFRGISQSFVHSWLLWNDP